ncbi:hypothetical protein [Streptomyces sp. NPDC057052]|uniref:hypothetical protein n=1 Tax=Streptomyces sp. NPDC057052 TaxID=3346010 RepID=UPI0036332267
MNVKRNVVPRDIGDSPVCRALALFFWGFTTLVVLGPSALLVVVSLAWAQPVTSVTQCAEAVVLQVGIGAAVLTPLCFVPGFGRLARSARFALLGPVAAAVALAVFLCVGLPEG